MKMTDYPCLYRLAEADLSIQSDFFCGLGGIFALTESELIEHSVLFAHASKGVLFSGQGLNCDLISDIGKKRLEKPFSSCKALVSKYTNYNLKSEACRYCKLSHDFKNYWIKDERFLISCILQKGSSYANLLESLTEANFISVCPIIPSSSLRSLPLITFNAHLLSFLKSVPDFDSISMPELIDKFAPFLHDKIREEQKKRMVVDAASPHPVNISFSDILTCIKRELNAIYDFMPDAFTHERIIKTRARNRDVQKFVYSPPCIKHGSVADGSEPVTDALDSISNRVRSGRKKTRNPLTEGLNFQISVMDIISTQATSSSAPDDTTLDSTPSVNANSLNDSCVDKTPIDNSLPESSFSSTVPGNLSYNSTTLSSDNSEINLHDCILINSESINDKSISSLDAPCSESDDFATDSLAFKDVSCTDTHEKFDPSFSVDSTDSTESIPDIDFPVNEPADASLERSLSSTTPTSVLLDNFDENCVPVCTCYDCLYAYNYLKHPVVNAISPIIFRNNNDIFRICESFVCFDPCFCGLQFPRYALKQQFCNDIINCCIDDIHSIHTFLSDSCSSRFIGIEATVMYGQSGLLFYMCNSGRSYFFDVEFALSKFLKPILAQASKITYLSLNSIPVYHMLNKLGFQHLYIESIPNLFTIAYHTSHNIPFSAMFHFLLGSVKSDSTDFYQFAMPLYHTLYDTLMNEVNKAADSKLLLARYRSMNYFNGALSTAFDLSDVVLDLHCGVLGLNEFDYQLNYTSDMSIISTGNLYVVNFPLLVESVSDNDRYKLFQDIVSTIYSLPYQSVSYARLLSISPAGIAYFCVAHGDEFFDILLDCCRKKYREVYQKVPFLDTKRIVY